MSPKIKMHDIHYHARPVRRGFPYLYLHRNIVHAILIMTRSRARETFGYALLNL